MELNKNQISKELLEDLYWNRGLSLSQIGKVFGMKSKNAVIHHMDKFAIKRRPSDRRNYIRIEFSGNLEEKAYLLGLRTGDLHARKDCKLIQVETTSTHEAQLKMFREAFEKYAPTKCYEKKGGLTERTNRIYVYLDGSFNFIIEKPPSIPQWILDDEKCFFYFLSGYSDSEGSWIMTQHKKYKGNWKDLVFSLGTCDKNVLEQIHKNLKEFGFNSHLYQVEKANTKRESGLLHNFDMYRVMIMSHKHVVRLAETLLPLSKHDEKIEAMNKIINYYKQNQKNKLLKRQTLGTIDLSCVKCGNKSVWKNGYSKYKDKRYNRYKCPMCKAEFER